MMRRKDRPKLRKVADIYEGGRQRRFTASSGGHGARSYRQADRNAVLCEMERRFLGRNAESRRIYVFNE